MVQVNLVRNDAVSFIIIIIIFKSNSKQPRFGTILKFYYQVQNGIVLVLEF